MTRAMGAALETHYQGAVTTIAFCVNLVLARFQPRITGITKANPGAATTRWAHGYVTGDSIKIVGVEGMTQVNDLFYTVTVTGASTFTLGVDTTGYSTYTAGSWNGTARRVLGFTNHVRDLTFGGVVYHSSIGGEGSSVSTKADMSITSRDVTAMIDSVLITAEDLERGLYSGAEYETFEVNYLDLTQGRLLLEYGRIGDITIQDQVFVCEGLSLVNTLHQNIGPQISITCRAQLGNKITDLYDERYGCKVRLNPPTWLPTTAYTVVVAGDAALGSIVKPTVYNGCNFKCTTAGTSGASEPAWVAVAGSTTTDGTVTWTAFEAFTKQGTVTQTTDKRTLRDANRLEAFRYWNNGLLTFLSGNNKGWSSEIKEFNFDNGPVFQAAGTVDLRNTTGILTPSMPISGAALGDSYWLQVIVRNQTTTVTTPSGWSVVSGPNNVNAIGRTYIFGKVADLTETTPVTVTFGTDAAVGKMAQVYRIRRGGIIPQGAAVLVTGTGTTITGPTISSTSTNNIALGFVSRTTGSGGGVLAFAGETGGDWQENADSANSTFAVGLQLQTAAIASPGTITGGTMTTSTCDWLVIALVLPVSSEYVLRDQAPNVIQVGDTYEVEIGCDKIHSTCISKFNNIYNFRGEPYIPGLHKQFLFPNSTG